MPFLARLCAVALIMVVLSVSRAQSKPSVPVAGSIRHVFVVVLENEDFDTTFGRTSAAPYLAHDLVTQGAILTQYHAIGHYSLDNYIAMISGQAPNPETQGDCQRYTDFALAGITPDGQAIGTGCVYPANVKTLADQLAAAGFTWKGYLEDMGNDPARENATCGHPVLGETDRTEHAEAPTTALPAGDQYAAKHNPFVYFHSIIDSPSCQTSVVNLSLLTDDLTSVATTPNFSFIAPNLCNDGHDAPCKTGKPGGLVSANAFLQTWIPKILNSPAYQQDGLLIVAFDEAEDDASACCGELAGPNAAVPGRTGPGGGRTGEVLLSKFIKPGTVSVVPYNHYAQLKTLEDLFGLSHLGYAAQPGLADFGADVFSAASHP
jgi:phospholipase C